ncbi:MAG TPA: hypothetical protein H9870_14185 [Candidatus Corynebacterium avicola]|uniref:Uncharacterized protein n=1 Tax=Candidatus Corynebacterium avicola TaxID=2838527 RepID=A0A9D1RT35_9CORY|nr:hypothetical protein [Candidatus Corynebacterium avicola]
MTSSALRLLSKHPAVRVGKVEVRLWRDLWYLIRGRNVIPDRATPLPATSGIWFLPAAVTVATAIEITAVELLVPWPELRIILAIVSVYSLIILWAMLGRQKTYPHYVDAGSLVLRRGGRVLVDLPRTGVKVCVRERRYDTTRPTVDDSVLVLGTGEGTNLRLTLDTPAPVVDPDRWPWQRPAPVEVTQILLWLDDPSDALTALHGVDDHHVAVGLAGDVRRHGSKQTPGQ